MKILFLQKRPLFPANTGGKIRTLNVLRKLAKWHEITYLCNLQQGEERFLDPMRELGLRVETIPWKETPRGSFRFFVELACNLVSAYPYSAVKDYDPVLCRRAQQLLDAGSFDLVVCDFVQMARNAMDLVGPPKILFQHNVEAQIFARHAERDQGYLRRCFMALQCRKMRNFERRAGQRFDAVIAVSAQDEEIFRQNYGWNHVRTIDTAVDLDYFQPWDEIPRPGRIVFVGSMDWLPNQDGVTDFVSNVWTRITRERPGAEFHIVGRNPTAEISRLNEVPGVVVQGTVADVRPHLAAAEICVVPLRIGGGTRLKIFEAMAMEKAVVSTTIGAEGLPVVPGEHLVIADQHDAFAGAIVDLLDDGDKRRQLALSAKRLVQVRFSTETVARQFNAICLETVTQSDGVRSTATDSGLPDAAATNSRLAQSSND